MTPLPYAQRSTGSQENLKPAEPAKVFEKTHTGNPVSVSRIGKVKPGTTDVMIRVTGMDVMARVDSGAEISIMADRIYKLLDPKPKPVALSSLQLAGRAMMEAKVVEPVTMQLGSRTFKERLYVADIRDDFLLGHDFLTAWGASLDWGLRIFEIQGEQIPLVPYLCGQTG